MAGEKQKMTDEQIEAASQAVDKNAQEIINRMQSQIRDDDLLPACIEASKAVFAHFVAQLMEHLRISNNGTNPDEVIDGFMDSFKQEVIFRHQQILTAPAMITPEDLKNLH